MQEPGTRQAQGAGASICYSNTSNSSAQEGQGQMECAMSSFQETHEAHELLDSNRELVFATLHTQQDEMADATGVTTGQARPRRAREHDERDEREQDERDESPFCCQASGVLARTAQELDAQAVPLCSLADLQRMAAACEQIGAASDAPRQTRECDADGGSRGASPSLVLPRGLTVPSPVLCTSP